MLHLPAPTFPPLAERSLVRLGTALILAARSAEAQVLKAGLHVRVRGHAPADPDGIRNWTFHGRLPRPEVHVEDLRRRSDSSPGGTRRPNGAPSRLSLVVRKPLRVRPQSGSFPRMVSLGEVRVSSPGRAAIAGAGRARAVILAAQCTEAQTRIFPPGGAGVLGTDSPRAPERGHRHRSSTRRFRE